MTARRKLLEVAVLAVVLVITCGCPCSIYPPEEARRLYERFEVHHTPKHASWLNMAECELSVLGRQCLDRRIDSQELLTTEVAAWQQPRNAAEVRVDWQFRTPDARIKLKRLYPTLALDHKPWTGH